MDFDPEDRLAEGLQRIAPTMNQLDQVADGSFFFDAMSDAIVWHDELPHPAQRGAENFWGLRPVLRYRASLIQSAPDDQWQKYWTFAQTLFPKWIGFSPSRTKPDADLAKFIEESIARVRQELDEMFDS